MSDKVATHLFIQRPIQPKCPGHDSRRYPAKDLRNPSSVLPPIPNVSIPIEETHSPFADRSDLNTISYSESITVTTTKPIETDTGNMTCVQSNSKPKLKVRLASLGSGWTRGCGCCRYNKLLDWERMKERFSRLFVWTLNVVTTLRDIGIGLVKIEVLHVVRHIFVVIVISCLVQLLISLKDSPEDIVLPSMGIVVYSAYAIFHNVYFCFLHKHLRLESCGKDYIEILQVTTILHTFLAAISNVLVLCFCASIACIETPFIVTVRTLLLAATILEVLSDGHLFLLLCVPVFMTMFGLIVIGFLLFSFCYAIHFAGFRRCRTRTSDESAGKKKEALGTMLGTVALPCSEAQAMITCAICLQDMLLGEEVIELDCCVTHVYHKHCIHEWVCRANLCPICRAEVLPANLYCFD